MVTTSRLRHCIALGAAVFAVLLAVPNVSEAAILNGGFEDPDIAPTAYTYPDATLDDWTYSGGAGLINATVSPNAWWPGGSSPTGYGGDQFAFVQSDGTLSQTFSATPGLAAIDWLEAGRPNTGCCNGDQSYEVILNGIVIGSYSTTDGQNFTPESVNVDLLSSNILTFEGLLETDNTAFIDNVALATATPLPATWIMLLSGLTGLMLLTGFHGINSSMNAAGRYRRPV
jgi:hypothetical protein